MSDLRCLHCELPWRVAAMSVCEETESGQHFFVAESVRAVVPEPA